MKKIILLLSAMLIGLFAFTSCDDSDDDGVIIEDGIYVVGEAAGSAEIAIDLLMGAGRNEANENALRDGMYEKYVALEAGKEFTLVEYVAGAMTYYGATLAEDSLKGEGEQPDVVVKKGELVIGATAPKMMVSASGLYHIVLDLNTAEDLASKLIVVAPVTWGVRGDMNGWSFDAFDATEFNHEQMVFTKTYEEVGGGIFKYAYGGGWKIQLDQAGNVKANTNLGMEDEMLVPGAGDIDFRPGTDITFTLTWDLKAGAIKNGFTQSIAGDFTVVDPAAEGFFVGVAGNAFGPDADWSDPAGATLAVYSATASTVTDADSKAGSYVFELTNIQFEAGKEFKARVNGGWYGGNAITITGDTGNFSGDDNIAVAATKTYSKVTVTLDWNGYKANSITYNFAE